jgi:catechol 2,3-dioxygenase-like lactoylglutathione lyase family enzyme
LTGVERVTFAVEDLAEACQYAQDWGLSRAGDVFATIDGCEVEFVESTPDQRPVGDPSGLFEVTWGARDESCVRSLHDELSTDRATLIGDDGVLRCVDDLGIRLAFRPSRRVAVGVEPTTYNSPARPSRVNRRGARYEQARPHEISHLAIAVDDAAEAARFYVERLGFRISDRYADRGVFMRCSPSGNHHHLFLLNGTRPGTRCGHLAFKVRDIHEVIAGGQAFDAKGWKTFAGPGRHMVSSANFWYFVTPFGGSWEYAADEDIVTEEWEANDFAAEAHIFSEWTFGLEKSDGTLRGPISESRTR